MKHLTFVLIFIIFVATIKEGSFMAKAVSPVTLKTGIEGINVIERFESLKLNAYLCPAGVWTIGIGTTRINGKPVQAGMRITEEEAYRYLYNDLRDFENVIHKNVKVPLTQNQFDALSSLVYNIGGGNFLKSEVLLRLDGGEDDDYYRAALAFMNHVWARDQKGKFKRLKGLERRRKVEYNLFMSDIDSTKMMVIPPVPKPIEKLYVFNRSKFTIN